MDPQSTQSAPFAPGTQRTPKEGSSWGWVGCGCGILLLLAALVVSGVFLLFHRQERAAAEARRNPGALTRRAEEIVSYLRLPDGYHPVSTLSIPYVMEMAIFADRDLEKAGPATLTFPAGTHSFMYIKTLRLMGGGTAEGESRRLLSPRRNDMPSWMKSFGFEVRRNQTVRAGQLTSGGHTVVYKAVRSRLQTPSQSMASLMTMMLVECPSSRWTHTALWMTPDPAPDKPLDDLDLAGTAADPQAIETLLSGFALCQGR